MYQITGNKTNSEIVTHYPVPNNWSVEHIKNHIKEYYKVDKANLSVLLLNNDDPLRILNS